MLKPEWAPPLDNVHPQKSQSFTPAGIHIGLAHHLVCLPVHG